VYRGSLPGVTDAIQANEERDVPEETAAYLVGTFPGCFEVAKPSPKKPMRDRMVDNGAGDLSVLDLPARKIKIAIKTGQHDSALLQIRAAELAGKTRSTVIAILERRIADVQGAL